MPTIRFLPMDKETEVRAGTLLADAARSAGIAIDLPCGGKGTCGKCLVRVSDGSVDLKPSAVLTDGQRAAGLVPACQAAVTMAAAVTIPEESLCTVTSIVDDSIDLVCEHAPEIADLSPPVQRTTVRVAGPVLEDGLSDLDRLCRALAPAPRDRTPHVPLSVIRNLAGALRERNGEVTAIIAQPEPHGDGLDIQPAARVIQVLPGRGTGHLLGIAVDLGTTTISVRLVDLETGRVLSSRNGYNDQIHCGLDVISRINYASTGERLEDLRARAVLSINRLVAEAVSDAGADANGIFACTVSGNTVMTHLLLGLVPEYIRLEPYTPTVFSVPCFTAAELGIAVNPGAVVRFSPCVGSYVGGDITAGILATDLVDGREGIGLLIDIGTNGEIVVGNSDFLMTCACSAGPAFEGAGIDCGMRATTGAIDRVTVDRDTGMAQFTTIGGAEPSGICGSGLIDLVAGLFLTGWVDASGRLSRDRQCSRIRINGRRAVYYLVEAHESAINKPVFLTETDIENLMRAKAAIYSAASLLLEQAGIGFNDLSAFYVAGGFGRFLDLEHAVSIGLLPDIPLERFRYLGNASLLGSSLCLLSRSFREAQNAVAGRMTYIDLSTFPGYMDQYTAALFLPHTDLGLFPSVWKRKNN